MRIPLLDFEMELDGRVILHEDGSIELLPCPLTDLISKREGLIFDAFYICFRDSDAPDALLCAYTAFYEQDYVIYDICLSDSEFQMLMAL